ncbi:MAG TPA: hypothetical protein VG737_03430 [Cyclobacteriaceae bacterium]|nr:hypothetical protein [Cyclobacteriaceae bacterium]
MSKQKTEARVPAKKRTPAKRDSTRRTVSTSRNDNQNQIDNHSDTTPGETPKRKPVTNADAQKKTSNADSNYNEDEEGGDNVRHLPRSGDADDGYEGPNDPSKRGDDPDKTRREQPKMK